MSFLQFIQLSLKNIFYINLILKFKVKNTKFNSSKS